MFVLIDIALILFAAVLMTGSFFVIERTRSSNLVLGWKLSKMVSELLVGIIYSGIFVLLQIIMHSIWSKFNIQIFLIGFVTLVVVSNFRIASFSFPIALVYYLLLNNVDAAMYANVIVFLTISMVYIIVDQFIKGYIGKLITYGVAIGLSLISLFVLAFPFRLGLNPTTFELSMLSVLMLPLFETLISYAIRVSVSANILYESVNYDFGKFYRESLRNVSIGRVIKDRKIEQAFYGVFKIDFEAQGDEEKDKEITEGVLSEIQKVFPLSSVLFKVDESNYGFFLPTNFKNKINMSIASNNLQKRDEQDPLVALENILAVASKSFKTSFNKFIDVDIFAGIAIYGIQESSIEALDKDAKFALKINELKVENRVTLFDPKMYRNKVSDSHALQALDKAVGLDDYANRFTPIYDVENETTRFNYVNQINTSETEFIDEVRSFIDATGMMDVFERFFAVDAISKVGSYKGDLILDYSIAILNEEFNIKEFIRRLGDFKFSPTRLVLATDSEEINDIDDLGVVKLRMKELRETGVRFASKGLAKTKLKTEFRLISSYGGEFDPKKFDEEIIIYDLDVEDKVENILDKGIKFVGGPLFERNVIPNNFNKQSRIYIEDIKSRKR